MRVFTEGLQMQTNCTNVKAKKQNKRKEKKKRERKKERRKESSACALYSITSGSDRMSSKDLHNVYLIPFFWIYLWYDLTIWHFVRVIKAEVTPHMFLQNGA
jgi:hypothetical protein